MDYKVILGVVIAIVVFAFIVTCIVVVYLRQKKSRGSERGKNNFRILRIKIKCFVYFKL